MKVWLVAAALLALPCAHALAVPGLSAGDAAAPAVASPAPPFPQAGAPAADDAPGDKRIEFVCPEPDGPLESYRYGSPNVIYGCPMRIYDNTVGGNTGWLFGNIDLAVHPTDPAKMAFFTLHGSAVRDGPSPYSRSGLTHSIFSSDDHGLTWVDSWTNSGEYPGSEWLGEMATGAFDDDGNLYAAFLWTVADGVAGQAMDSLVGAYKLPGVEQGRDYMEMYAGGAKEFHPRSQGGFITRIDMVHVPGPESIPDANATAPQGPGTPGQRTDNATRGDGHVVLAWHERAADPAAGPMSAWIELSTTRTGARNTDGDWSRMAQEDLVGPCREMSNAVTWDGKVYFLCSADLGYDARRGAEVADLDLWAYDPGSGKAEYVSATGVNGDNPQLAVTPDGYFALAASRLQAAQDVDVVGAMGWYGRHWDHMPPGLGAILHQAMGGHPMVSAHVTGVAVLEESKTVFVTYKEWNDVPPAPDVDPNDPTATPRLADFHKFVFTTNACGELIAGAEFVLGTSPDLYQQEAAKDNQGAFDDRHDGLWTVRMPDGEERVQFAVSDYGAAQFGQMRGATGASGDTCPLLAVPPPAPVPVLPQAATLANPALLPAGLLVGAGVSSMVAYLVFLKRRTAVVSSVKA